jgi:hypothetical protein
MIDLSRQLIDLFNKEQMLAFFDFQLTLVGNEPVSGLCKISRPKGTGEQTQYVSLLFLIDTPSDALWEHVNTFVNHISWEAFKRELPMVDTVLSIPHLIHKTGIYFKETAIYLSSDHAVSKYYVSSKLYPAILKVMGLKAGELIFWEDLPESKQEINRLASEKGSPHSLVARLKDFFGL